MEQSSRRILTNCPGTIVMFGEFESLVKEDDSVLKLSNGGKVHSQIDYISVIT